MINRKGQVGKILSAFPVMILVFIIMAAFIALSFSAAGLLGSTKGSVPYVKHNDLNLLLKPVKVEVGRVTADLLLFDAFLFNWNSIRFGTTKISAISDSDNYDFGKLCFSAISRYNERKDGKLQKIFAFGGLKDTVIFVEREGKGEFNSGGLDRDLFSFSGRDNQYRNLYPNIDANDVFLEWIDNSNGVKGYITFDVYEGECKE